MKEMELSFGLDYRPAVLRIQDFDHIMAEAEAIAHKYKNLVVTDETTAEARASQAELNKYIKEINEARKSRKREYEIPLKAFEDQVKQLTGVLEDAKEPIKEALHNYTVKAQQDRLAAAQADLADVLASRDLTIEDVPMQQGWYDSNATKTKRLREMAAAADLVINTRKARENAKQAVSMFAESKGLDAGGWIAMVDHGVEQSVIMQQISERAEQVAQQAKAKADREAAQAAIAAATQTVVADKVIDTDTGEVIEEQPQTQTFEFGMVGTIEEAQGVVKYMTDHGIDFYSLKK